MGEGQGGDEGLPVPAGSLQRADWAGGLGSESRRCEQQGSGGALLLPKSALWPVRLASLSLPRRFELVKGLLPEEYHKVLVNIRKAEARAKRHRALSQATEEEEQEEEEESAQGKGDR